MNSNYLKFENKFRGDPASIRNQFSCYDSLIEKIIADIENPKFIDIGSGRGEWIKNWNQKVKECYGLECNSEMVELTRSMGLEIVHGDEITSLRKFSSSTISLITIFHMIDQLKHEELVELLAECHRVLSPSGVLIMETPSFDNIMVSTKPSYPDYTHITHINPESLIFELDNIGFDHSKYFYINCGPMQNECPTKITRILNGVAQDVLFISTKEDKVSRNIFDESTWLSNFQLGITTMQAAVDFDLNNEKIILDLNMRIRDLNEKIIIWEEQIINQRFFKKPSIFFLNDLDILTKPIKILIVLLKVLRKLFKPVKIFLGLMIKYFKRLIRSIFRVMYKILNLFINKKLINKFVFSDPSVHMIHKIIEFLPEKLMAFNAIKIKANLLKIIEINSRSSQFNRKLSAYYNTHLGPKNIKNLLNNKLHKKKY